MPHSFFGTTNLLRIAIFLTLCGGFFMIYLKLENYMLLAEGYEEGDPRQKRSADLTNIFLPSIGDSYDLDVSPEYTETVTVKPEAETLVWYNQSSEIIWVGGCPRSGTTLSRAMLDVHPDIRCGEETHIIPLLLDFHANQLANPFMKNRLAEAKVTGDVLGDALAAYLLTIIWEHGSDAPRLCNKDPMVLNHMEVVNNMFPKSLFVMMIRDGRAVCHSMISREVKIGSFDTETYRGCLEDWNKLVEFQYQQCLWIGSDKCRLQYYEQLVINPEDEMKELLDFLNVDWNESVLHHTEKIGEDDGISLSS